MYMDKFPITKEQQELALNTFIFECAIQAYEFGEMSHAYQLFKHQIGIQPTGKVLSFMTKNMLGLKKFGIL